jgi:hypothetical protein
MTSSPCTHHCLTTCYHHDDDDIPLVYKKDEIFRNITARGEPTISFYIPRIDKGYDEQDVINTFNALDIGQVMRVDFAPLAPIPPGVRESAESIRNPFQKAFVHMAWLYKSETAKTITSEVLDADNSFRVYPWVKNNHEYWILLNNKMAVPATKLNVHQMAENHRILEQTVMTQAKQIAELKAMVEQLLKK